MRYDDPERVPDIEDGMPEDPPPADEPDSDGAKEPGDQGGSQPATPSQADADRQRSDGSGDTDRSGDADRTGEPEPVEGLG